MDVESGGDYFSTPSARFSSREPGSLNASNEDMVKLLPAFDATRFGLVNTQSNDAAPCSVVHHNISHLQEKVQLSISSQQNGLRT